MPLPTALLYSLICTSLLQKSQSFTHATSSPLPSLEVGEDIVIVTEIVELVEIVIETIEVVDVVQGSNYTLPANSSSPYPHHHHQGHHGPGHNHFSQVPPLPVPNPQPSLNSDPSSDSQVSTNLPIPHSEPPLDPPPEPAASNSEPLSDPPPNSDHPTSDYLPVPNGRGPYPNTGGVYYHQSAPFHYSTMAASAVISGVLALSSLVPSLPQSATNGKAIYHLLGSKLDLLICRCFKSGTSYDTSSVRLLDKQCKSCE